MFDNGFKQSIFKTNDFVLDDISKRVADKLSGVALKERVDKESKMFSNHKISICQALR